MPYSHPVTVLFIGGGNRFYVFAGVLQALIDKGLKIGRLIGASTGSIIAALYAAGYESDQIRDLILDLDTDRFKDQQRRGLRTTMGLYAGNALSAWLQDVFGEKHFAGDLRVPLQIITTDLQNYRPMVFTHDFLGEVSLASACRASAAIPWVFAPLPVTVRNRDHLLVDGSLMSGLIELAFARTGSERILTFKVVSKRNLHHPGVQRRDWRGYWSEIFSFYLHAQEKEYIKGGQWRDNILINCGTVSPVRFTLSRDERKLLITEGYAQTLKYLEYKCGL